MKVRNEESGMKVKNAMRCILVDCKNWNHSKEKSQHDLIDSLHNSAEKDFVEVTNFMCKLDTLFSIQLQFLFKQEVQVL